MVFPVPQLFHFTIAFGVKCVCLAGLSVSLWLISTLSWDTKNLPLNQANIISWLNHTDNTDLTHHRLYLGLCSGKKSKVLCRTLQQSVSLSELVPVRTLNYPTKPKRTPWRSLLMSDTYHSCIPYTENTNGHSSELFMRSDWHATHFNHFHENKSERNSQRGQSVQMWYIT